MLKTKGLNFFFTLALFILVSKIILGQVNSVVEKHIVLNAGARFQTIDGFGANVNPAEWRNGSMKPALDSIVKGLGCTLIRFDCFGFANWLDPKMQLPGGTFSKDYLKKVYTSLPFKNAWAAFRYLNQLGIEPIFNISGAVPDAWTTINPVPRAWTVLPGSSHDRLQNFGAYATMVATMLKWAREEEHLKFNTVMPFNETDLGFPEGPRVLDEDCAPAFDAIVEELETYGLGDLMFVIMDDSDAKAERIEMLLKQTKYAHKIKAIGLHSYGGGETARREVRKTMDSTGFANTPIWLTEYGDLDQTGEIEFEVGWRMTQRLVTAMNNNIPAAIVWDAFDNFHKHDTAFALYGLLKTDTTRWLYFAKPRYYAAKQIYKFVLPGFQRIQIETPDDKPSHIYNEWNNTLRNMPLAAFTSPDGNHMSLTGMNATEKNVRLDINFKEFGANLNSKLAIYITNTTANCKKMSTATLKNKSVSILIPAHTMFTATTLK